MQLFTFSLFYMYAISDIERYWVCFYRDEDWWDNDGALNTISMTHPRFPVEHPSHLVVKDSECQPMQPGIWLVPFPSSFSIQLCHISVAKTIKIPVKSFDLWCATINCRYYKIVDGDHILFIVNRERAGVQFDLIYDSIFERCRKHAFRKNPTMPNQVHQ